MPINIPTAFQWHSQTQVQLQSQANENMRSDDIGLDNDSLVFISDTDSAICFAQLQYAIELSLEFCVYPGDSPFFNSVDCSGHYHVSGKKHDSDTKARSNGDGESACFYSLSGVIWL